MFGPCTATMCGYHYDKDSLSDERRIKTLNDPAGPGEHREQSGHLGYSLDW